MLATLALISLVVAPIVQSTDPAVRISLNNDGRYERGDQGRVKVRVAQDGYLIVLHADPDGRVSVLYPLDPSDDAFVRGNSWYQLRDRGGQKEVFDVPTDDGRGVILAAVSRAPLHFGRFERNRHWSYDALNARDPRGEEESALVELVNDMVNGAYDYDIATYLVNDRPDVVYATTYVTPRYHNYSYSSCYYSYFSYDCDPYYYNGSRLSIVIGSGYPYYYRPAYYSPYSYGYRPVAYYPAYYDPYYYRPVRRGGYGYQPYTPTYRTPSEFKQDDRTWGGLPYRDRSASAGYVNTVYDPAPVRRGTSTGDAGRSPVYEPSKVVGESRATGTPTIERRRVEPTNDERIRAAQPKRAAPPKADVAPSTSDGETRAAPRRVETPTTQRAPAREAQAPARTNERPAERRRSNSESVERAAPARSSDDASRVRTEARPTPAADRPQPRRVQSSQSTQAAPSPRRAESSGGSRATQASRPEPRSVQPDERPARTSAAAPSRAASPERSAAPARAAAPSGSVSRPASSVSRPQPSSQSSGGRRTSR